MFDVSPHSEGFAILMHIGSCEHLTEVFRPRTGSGRGVIGLIEVVVR